MVNQKKRLHLLQVKGSPFEIGMQHGAYAKEEGCLTTPLFYSNFLSYVLQFRVKNVFQKGIRAALAGLIRTIVERGYIQNIPVDQMNQIKGFAKGGGVKLSDVIYGYVMPDVYSYLLARKYRFLNLGCSTFIWKNDDAFFHGRNLDYVGGEYWNRAPLVLEVQPKEGQRYASIVTVGVDSAGVTSMNESGIALSLHLNYSKNASFHAQPVVTIGQEVISKARNLNEAKEILARSKRSAGWSWMISSGDEGKAMVAQGDSKEIFFEEMTGDSLVLTNHFRFPSLKNGEFWISEKRKWDTETRIKILSNQVRGDPTLKGAIELLGEHKMTFGGTISQVHTTTSALLDPKNRKVYVASGEAPVANSDFVSVELFTGKLKVGEVIRSKTKNPIDHAREDYARAFEAYFPSHDLDRVEKHLRNAVSLAPKEKLFATMLNLVIQERETQKRPRTFLDFTLGEELEI